MILNEPERTAFDLEWRMFGTTVRIHPLFWAACAITGWYSTLRHGVSYLFVWMACVFVSILIHEFGHIFMGRMFGYHGNVVLHGFGGLAIGSSGMSNRWQRIAVSFAGPLAGFLYLGLIVGVLYLSLPHQVQVQFEVLKALLGLPIPREMAGAVLAQLSTPTLQDAAIQYLIWINLFWGLMNLLPIWPLDGGQISSEVFGWLAPRVGLQLSLGLSFLLAALIAVNALMIHYGREPLIPFLRMIGSLYTAILFGLLALENLQHLSQVQASRNYWDDDRSDRWDRDQPTWRR